MAAHYGVEQRFLDLGATSPTATARFWPIPMWPSPSPATPISRPKATAIR
ncbi:MAG: hypothetical protein ACLTDR_15400 [Adlercreutzia equolifaciens]